MYQLVDIPIRLQFHLQIQIQPTNVMLIVQSWISTSNWLMSGTGSLTYSVDGDKY